MKIRRVVLWGLPILALFSLIIFTWMPQYLSRQQAAILSGWTYTLQYESGIEVSGVGLKTGNIGIDPMGNIWVAKAGLHVFDGLDWNSREGPYVDLAMGPSGSVWAAYYAGSSVNGVDVFDGEQWKNYEIRDLGIEEQDIHQVEVSSDGRVWIKTEEYGTDRLLEIINQQTEDYPVVSDPILTITDGDITSLDADRGGNLWIGVLRYEEDTLDWPSGLYVFDGESLNRVPDQGLDLRHVIQTRVDDQGSIWVMTENGDLMNYDGHEWTNVVDEYNSPIIKSHGRTPGFFIDKKSRKWLWQHDEVHLLNDGVWTSFTRENSGLAEIVGEYSGVFGVIVDDIDRLWVASDDGVSMIPVDNAKPFPEESVRENRVVQSVLYRTKGMNWFLPTILLILWLAVYLNRWPPVLLALSIGVFATLVLGPPQITFFGYNYSTLNPGLLATYCGMLGGLLAGQRNRENEKISNSKLRLNYVLAIIGLVVGFGLGIFWYIGSTP